MLPIWSSRGAHCSRLGCDGQQLRRSLQRDATDRTGVARLERVLLAQMAARPPVSAVVLAIDRALRMRPAHVTDFAALAGVSPRRLQRLCLHTFGFAPKRLMRLQRFLDTLGQIRPLWANRWDGRWATTIATSRISIATFVISCDDAARVFFGATPAHGSGRRGANESGRYPIVSPSAAASLNQRSRR